MNKSGILIPTQTLEEAESQMGTDRVQLALLMIFFNDAKEVYYFEVISERKGAKKSARFCRFIREVNLHAILEMPI